jgi:Neuraminidase (sialidase)
MPVRGFGIMTWDDDGFSDGATCRFHTARFYFDTPDKYKKLHGLAITYKLASTINIPFYYSTDGGDNWVQFSSANYAGSASSKLVSASSLTSCILKPSSKVKSTNYMFRLNYTLSNAGIELVDMSPIVTVMNKGVV